MNLADVMDELFQVLGDIPGFHVPGDGPGVLAGGFPQPHVQLPAVNYGEYGHGLDRIPDLELIIVFGPVNNVQVFRDALEAASTQGQRSVPAALLEHQWESCHTLRPGQAEPTTVEPRAGNPLLGYVFHLDISGAP
jgi:hypothetical protein